MKSIGIFVGLLILAIGGFALVPSNDEGAAVGAQTESIELGNANNDTKAIEKEEDKNFPPDFTLKNLDGNEITLSDYRGKKAVVIDFWASWCPNCRRDMPVMQKLYEEYGDEVEVIAINLQESKSKVSKFVESNNFTYPILLDPASTAARSYGVNYTNYHVLINKEGQLVKSVPGDISEKDFRSLIN